MKAAVRAWSSIAVLLGASLAAQAGCGTRLSLPAEGGATQAYTLAEPAQPPQAIALLLVGGGGALALGSDGCPSQLKGNALVRIQPRLLAAGCATVLLDAPSKRQGEDGLGGYRVEPAHAQDIGALIAALHERFPGRPVWLIGTSRGTISAANAAAQLSGTAAADGLVLSSILSNGQPQARKPWVAHSVFDLPLESIRQPVLLLGHAADRCLRSPPGLMPRVAERLKNAAQVREQLIAGGPAAEGQGGDYCEGRSAHGFVGQEAELVEALLGFMAQR